MFRPSSFAVLALCALLPLTSCQTGRKTPSPPLRLSTAPISRAVVYGPSGKTLRQLERAEAQQLKQLLSAGQPLRNVNPESFRFQPISYSVGFARGTATQWSAQFYGKAMRVVMPGGATLTYTKAQRREILRLVDPEKRWRY